MPGQRILVLGSGPTMIGQSREYNNVIMSACKVLHNAENSVILLDSHSASPVSGSGLCSRSYIEPLTREILEKILQKERPHSVLATVSGKNSFNLSLVLNQFSSHSNSKFAFLGTTGEILASTQRPEIFKQIVESAGAECPNSSTVNSIDKGIETGRKIGFPIIVRAIPEPSGLGVAIAYNVEELERAISIALTVSPIKQIVIEKSFAGAKSTDWVVLRDRRDNIFIVGSVEYIEPMGVHANDSIAVSPAQSISDESIAIAKETVERIARNFKVTGCATIQLAHDKKNDTDIKIISVTPMITRAAILCGRQAGIPVAEFHTRLCIDGNINELMSSSLLKDEANLFEKKEKKEKNFCVCRVPVFPGNRLMKKNELLTTYTKSVDSVTGVGMNFISALQKAVRASCLPEPGAYCIDAESAGTWGVEEIMQLVSKPFANRLWHILRAIKIGIEPEELINVSGIDKWFINKLAEFNEIEEKCSSIQKKDLISGTGNIKNLLKKTKQTGCSDLQLSSIFGVEEEKIREYRLKQKIFPIAKHLSGENFQKSPWIINYNSRKQKYSDDKPILIIGSCKSKPIGKAENEYILLEAIRELSKAGEKCILVSPETLHLADDEDVNVKRYIEPVNMEIINDIIEIEKPKAVLAQFSDFQTYALIEKLDDITVMGTSFKNIQRLLKRERFYPLIQKLDIRLPSHGIADNARDAFLLAEDIGYPVIVHPAAPAIIPAVDIWYSKREAKDFLDSAGRVKELYPISIEKFLEGGREFHIEGVCDKTDLYVGGIIEHIERAGVNTNDSAAVWAPESSAASFLEEGRDIIKRLAIELEIQGLIGIKLALLDDKLYLLDAFPGITENTSFINKISGEKLISTAIQVILGKSLAETNEKEPVTDFVAVSAPVFPFANFPDSDASLGPESCSVGKAVGLSYSFGTAYAKALVSAGNFLPVTGDVLLSVTDKDKQEILPIARKLIALGFNISATSGTYAVLQKHAIPAKLVMKFQEGRPNVIDNIIDGDMSLIINTPGSKANRFAEAKMRHEAVARGILVITTISAAQAAVEGIAAFMRHGFEIKPYEKYLEGLRFQHSLNFDSQPTLDFD
ncbi:MAG: carbamoyl-phosphate synthase large subunit [Chlamydiae bacterium]|nr:MAG: carbamoyl-phosphate synthase large subunit [Chlamydiota bacterium]